jgi:hypothetical protein
MTGSLDNGRVRMFDARDLVLWVTLDKNGLAEAEARIDKREAARALRLLADKWEADAAAAEAAAT